MRILAIRGQNLASLARSFAIDLVDGPLRGIGLFAITGPVGAGKSTLLDALCLALFDRTPRLSNRGGVPVGEAAAGRDDWLRSNDARTLLRRDAAEGFAEVDFTGRDGRRYRARWSVRRARRRVDGRVQDQQMSLVDLDRSLVVAGGRKTEVLAAIEARLGLDFGQFCRSVLLAQGDFAAFLEASADERARLLENLTGADVYRKLSRAAHARCKAEAEQVARLRASFDAQELLDSGARAALEGEIAALANEIATCATAVEVAQRYVSWYAMAAERQQQEADAAVALNEAIELDAAAEPRRRELARLQQAAALLPHWKHVQQRRVASGAAAGNARAVAAAAARAAGDVERARAALQPALAAAFGDGADAPPVVRDFERWHGALRRRADVEARLAALAAERPQWLEAQRCADGALPAVRQRVAAAEAAQQRAAEQVRAAGQANADPALADRVQRRHAAIVRRAAWQQAAQLLDEVDAAEAAAAAAAQSLREAEAERDELARDFPALVAKRDEAESRLQTARGEGERARALAGVEALRAHLVDGEPCPLCGAHEHPASGAPPHDVAAAEREAAAAQRAFDVAVRAVAEREAQRRQAEGTFATAARAAGRLLEVAQLARAQLAATELGTTDPAAARRQLEQWASACAGEERELEQLDERERSLAAAHATAVTAAAKVNDELLAARTAEQKAERAAADAATALARADAEADRLRETLTELDLTLGEAFGGVDDWRERASRGGADWLAAVAQAHELDHRVAEAGAAAAEAARQHREAAELADRIARECSDAEAEFAQALHDADVAEADVAEAARRGTEALRTEAQALGELAEAVQHCRSVLRERVEQRKKHEARDRPSLDAAEAHEALELARARKREAEQRLTDRKASLAFDDRVRRQRDEIAPRLEAAETSLATWQALDDLIGSSDGSSFVVFAQGLTLDLLLVEANRRLAELARRYRLERNPGAEMDFVVVDLDLGGSRRSVRTLSGGETFLVSLALALALATLAAPRSRVETLFLDEGFGTLDAQHLETALGALDALQATGCQVGVISHVDGFAERIGAAVEVRPSGGGQSRVVVRMR